MVFDTLQNHAAEADGFVRCVGILLQFRIDRDQPVFAADFHAVAGKEYRRHIGARRVAPERDKASPHLVKGGVGDKGHREAETI